MREARPNTTITEDFSVEAIAVMLLRRCSGGPTHTRRQPRKKLVCAGRAPLFVVCAQDGVYLENITEQRVGSEAGVLDLLSRGSGARTKGETQVRHRTIQHHTFVFECNHRLRARLPTDFFPWLLIGRADAIWTPLSHVRFSRARST